MTGRFTRPLFWLALALPALLMLADFARGAVPAMDLLHPSGEMSVRLLVAAMLPGPLAGFFGPTRFLRGWLAVRRNIGVAAFGYGVLHLVFYLVDMGLLAAILDELTLPAIWTGWLALLAMAGPAATSFDRAMRRLGRHRWKAVQRLAYPVMALSLAHWWLLDWKWQPATLHLLPLIAAWFLWMLGRRRRAQATKGTLA